MTTGRQPRPVSGGSSPSLLSVQVRWRPHRSSPGFSSTGASSTRRAGPTSPRSSGSASWPSGRPTWTSSSPPGSGGRSWRGAGPDEYRALLTEARSQLQRAETTYKMFLPELEGLGIRIVSVKALTRAERAYFGAYLAEVVAPQTDVLRVEALREVRSRALYLASGEGVLENLLRVPDGIPRLIEIPGRDNTYVRLGELLRLRSDLFLAGRTAPVLRAARAPAGGHRPDEHRLGRAAGGAGGAPGGAGLPPGGGAGLPAALGRGDPPGLRPGARRRWRG